MNYTSIKQSKKLQELGLNPESADMIYRNTQEWNEIPVATTKDFCKYELCDSNLYIESCIPCWSVGALLDIVNVPFELIKMANGYPAEYRAILFPRLSSDCCTKGYTLIETTYNMIVWLLENRYIKKSKDEDGKGEVKGVLQGHKGT